MPSAPRGQLAERVLRLVREAGWEPDADLRPEGRNGPLARSIAGYLEYWQRYAETWEFQTLLRARAIAGDRRPRTALRAERRRCRLPT